MAASRSRCLASRCLLAALATAAATPDCSAAAARNATKVALILRITNDGEPLTDYWKAISCAAIVGIRHANARDGRVVPELASITGPALTPLVYDSRSNAHGGLSAYEAAVKRVGAAAIVGPARSATAKPMGVMQSVDSVPSVSYWASSPQLSDQSAYPFFNRVFHDDNYMAKVTIGALRVLGWRHFSLLRADDAYGAGLEEALTVDAQLQQVELSRIARLRVGGTAQETDAAVRMLVGGSNVIVMIVFEIDMPAVTLTLSLWPSALIPDP